VFKRIWYHSDYYLSRSKIFLPYRHSARNNEEEEEQHWKKEYKIQNRKSNTEQYKISNQKKLNEKLKKELERIEDIYGKIFKNIHGAVEEIGNQERRKNKSKL